MEGHIFLLDLKWCSWPTTTADSIVTAFTDDPPPPYFWRYLQSLTDGWFRVCSTRLCHPVGSLMTSCRCLCWCHVLLHKGVWIDALCQVAPAWISGWVSRQRLIRVTLFSCRGFNVLADLCKPQSQKTRKQRWDKIQNVTEFYLSNIFHLIAGTLEGSPLVID